MAGEGEEGRAVEGKGSEGWAWADGPADRAWRSRTSCSDRPKYSVDLQTLPTYGLGAVVVGVTQDALRQVRVLQSSGAGLGRESFLMRRSRCWLSA